jgi:hypothetical protein
VHLAQVRRAAVLTDGATRAVDTFGLYGWSDLLDALGATGPAGILKQVREAEAADPQGIERPRNKLSDDATVVYCDGMR